MNKRTQLVAIFLIATGLTLGAYLLGTFDSWEEQVRDRFFLTQDAPADILILAIDSESITAIGQWPWHRRIFAQALDKLGEARAVGLDINYFESAPGDAEFASALRRAPMPVTLSAHVEDKSGLILEPVPLLREVAQLGITNIPLSADGVTRESFSHFNEIPSFASSLVEHSVGPDTFRISYLGRAGTVVTIPFIDLIEGRIPERILEDKIILIGATAEDLHDFVTTPFGLMSGVEAQSNIINTLEEGNFFKEASVTMGILLIVLINLVALMLTIRLTRFRTLSLALVAILVAIPVVAMALFSLHYLVPHLYLALGFLLTSGAGISLQYITTSKEKRFIRDTFGRYVAPEVVEELLRHPEKLSLGGERETLAILFSDIRGFTTISEGLSPEVLTKWLNQYLTRMTEIVLEHRGVVDKYIGDAVMAFWGAPLPNAHPVRDAALAGLEMIESLEVLNKEWQEEGLPPISIGVGINLGEVIVGNMGSEKRFDYTIIGDEVNFTSRLEGLNKEYKTSILVSESVAEALRSEPGFQLRELERVAVKGKSELKLIFELTRKK